MANKPKLTVTTRDSAIPRATVKIPLPKDVRPPVSTASPKAPK